MMTEETPADRPLKERLRLLAEATAPDKTPPLICKIIEVRRVIAEQRLRGHSWSALAGMLAQEGLNLADGTLRNYMAQIGHAEAQLHDAGNPTPSDAEIHTALRQKRAALQRPVGLPQNGSRPAASTTSFDPHENL